MRNLNCRDLLSFKAIIGMCRCNNITIKQPVYINQCNEATIQSYDELLLIDKDDVFALNQKGLALMSLRRNECSIECFNSAMKIEINEYLYINKGINHFINIQDWPYYYQNNMMKLFYVSTKHQKSIKTVKKRICIKVLQNKQQTKGMALQDQNKSFEAIQLYENIISINPKNEIAYRLKGLQLLIVEKYEEAIQNLNQAIELNNQESILYYYKSFPLFVLKEYDEALKCYDKAIELCPVIFELDCQAILYDDTRQSIHDNQNEQN